MLADNLENLLHVIGINDLPEEVVVDNGVYMDFHADLFSLIQEGVQNVSFINNAVRRMSKNEIVCELRECVEGSWYRVRFSVTQGPVCRVALHVVGKDTFSEENGFHVRGGK